ncbi:hypothetical protein [Pseudomonas sp. EL_65y_Pfl2_R96]|uniref:hypothetical protein n=1 Tax=Pseudomonas sp. EL_65y_Pfl2_R96 TaxID=3088699 RepID=UPI0030D9316C
MRTSLKWLVDKNKREMLAFMGAGIAVVIGGAWTAFMYFQNKPGFPLKIEASYNACIGAEKERCPPNTVFLTCGQSVADWAKKECSEYLITPVSSKGGGMCGYSVIAIKCTSGN